jgi:hypothetical protein
MTSRYFRGTPAREAIEVTITSESLKNESNRVYGRYSRAHV